MAEFIRSGHAEAVPARVPGLPDSTRHALPVGRSTSSPAIRARARRVVLLADALVGQARVLAEQNRRLTDEQAVAQRNERKPARELESLRRGRSLSDLDDPRPHRAFADAEAEHRASIERLDMIRADVAAIREQLDAASRLRRDASRSAEAILHALGDGGRIRSDLRESIR